MKTRILHTRFYEDSFVLGLSSKERFLFVYLLTNKRVELTGAYELPLPVIQLETGMTENEILKAFEKLEGKIIYVDNFVVILNILKYQDYSKGSDKQKQSYQKELEDLPANIRDIILTGSELVKNQLETSYKLVRNKKEERRNKKKEKEIKNKEKEFSEFWSKYPKKVARAKVAKKYPVEKHTKIMQGLEGYLEHWKEKKTELQYIPNPETWLNQERWNDELDGGVETEDERRFREFYKDREF